MAFKKIKKIFLLSASAQIIFIMMFYFMIDKPSAFSLTDVIEYSFSSIVLDSNNNVINVSLSSEDEWCVPVPLDKTGYWTVTAAVSIEDRRFFDHNGIDFVALGRAALSNIRAGRTVSGASTITSQLIRISRPRERTLYNKLLEFWSAWKLENMLGKSEILELYLNRAPFGGNIKGIEAAAKAYFDKSAAFLSLAESVTLISILRSPSRFRPDRYPERSLLERNTNLDFLASRGIITDADLELAKRETLPGRRFPIPNNASMGARHARRESNGKNFVASTIDSDMQLLLEDILSGELSKFPATITGAGIIVENSTGFVRAYVGNSRFGEELPDSQVDCGASLRSPGSTLKPFIYAAAFERGLLTPASLLADTPLSFGGNAPRNFDMSYRGPVSVRNALASSLNAPAVRTLRIVGYSGAKTLLNHFGFTYIDKGPYYYTDSLILGGCEVTLIQLAAAYRALAIGGFFSPLRWTNDRESNRRNVLSEEAAYLVTDVLQDERRLLPIYHEIAEEKDMLFSFKTGTSYGLRDAWTAGYSGNYTVVIWIGSPPGRGDARLVGMEAAAPVFLRVMRALPAVNETFLLQPDGVGIRFVCSLSGNVPNRYCPQTVRDLFISRISGNRLCELHQIIDGESVLRWPAALRNWMSDQGGAPPAKVVTIIRPSEGSTIIAQNSDSAERIFLSAEGDSPHYWYIDGKFIGISHADGLFTDVAPGTHKATVLSGNSSDTVIFHVKTPIDLLDNSFFSNVNVIN